VEEQSNHQTKLSAIENKFDTIIGIFFADKNPHWVNFKLQLPKNLLIKNQEV